MKTLLKCFMLAAAYFVVVQEPGAASPLVAAGCAEPFEYAEPGEFCNQTAALICGYWSDCGPGSVCSSPDGPGSSNCDADNAQCICTIIE